MPFDLFRHGSSYTLTRQDGLSVSLPLALRTKRYVILFIAGQWWAPCRGVTAQLKRFYSTHHDTHNFEVIFLSTDKSEGNMLDFFHDAHGDWLCLKYGDARNLEAELAGESALHPKQVPACLVFEIDRDALSGRNATEEHGQNVASEVASNSSTSQLSFARFITKQGREMLSRDKEGSLFPWYDDGWSDAAAVQRSASLRASSPPRTPPPTATTTASAVATPAKTTADGMASGNETKHVDVVLHTNPYEHPSVTTPATEVIIKHLPATIAQSEGHADVSAEKEKGIADSADEKSGAETAAADAAVSKDEKNLSPTAHHEAAPESERQLTYSKSPDSRDAITKEPSPSRVIIVDKVLATTFTVIDSGKDESGDPKETAGRADEEEEKAQLHRALEARLSAVMEGRCSTEALSELAGDNGGDDAGAVETTQ